MRNRIQTGIGLLFLLGILIPAASGQVSVAVADFSNESGLFHLDAWERDVPDYLIMELARHPSLAVVDRQRLQALLDEQALTMAGLTDTSAALSIGRLISARYLITGSIHENGGRVRIHAHIIHVASGRLISEKVESGSAGYMDRMVSVLANNLLWHLTRTREYIPRLTVRRYPDRWFAAFALGAGAAAWLVHDAYTEKRDAYRAALNLDDFNPLYTSANRLHRTRQILLGTAGAGLAGAIYCWLRNRSPETILAGESPVVLFPGKGQSGEICVGFQISF